MRLLAPIALFAAALTGAAEPVSSSAHSVQRTARADSDTARLIMALPATPAGAVLDGEVTEWQFTPASLGSDAFVRADRPRNASGAFATASSRASALNATVWMTLDEDGLWVAGRVDDDSVRLPVTVSSEEFMSADHAEIWLSMPGTASSTNPGLRGDERFARLFTRHYVPSGDSSIRELWAHEVEHSGPLMLSVPLPHCCTPRARSALRRTVDGWSFEIYIPSADLPATAVLPVSEMRVAVDIIDSDGRGTPVTWTSAPRRRWDDDTKFARLMPSRPLMYEMSIPVLQSMLARADSAVQQTTGAGAFYFPGRPVTLAFAAAGATSSGTSVPRLVPLGVVAEQASATCGRARAFEIVLGADSTGRPIPALVSVAKAEPRDTIASMQRLGGDDSLLVENREPCRHLRFDWFEGTSADTTQARYHVTVLTLDSAGVIARVLDENVDPIASGDSASGTWATAWPRRADSAPRNAFGVEWVNAMHDVLRKVYWRWDGKEKRYIASDSTGRFDR